MDGLQIVSRFSYQRNYKEQIEYIIVLYKNYIWLLSFLYPFTFESMCLISSPELRMSNLWAIKCRAGNEGKDRRGRNQSLSPFLHHFPAFFPPHAIYLSWGESRVELFHVPVPTCLNGLNTQQAKRNRSEFTSAWRARDDQPGSSDRESPVCASRTLLPRCWELFLVWMVFCSLSSLSPTPSFSSLKGAWQKREGRHRRNIDIMLQLADSPLY